MNAGISRTSLDIVDWHSLSWKIFLFCMAISFFVMIEPGPTDMVFCVAFGTLLLSRPRTLNVVDSFVGFGIFLFLWFTLVSYIFVEQLLFAATRAVLIEFYLIFLFLMTAYFAKIWGDYAFRMILLMLIIGGLIATIIGLLAYFDMIPNKRIFFRDDNLKRIKSTFKDPNVFGPYLVPSILAGLWITLTATRHRLLWAGVTCILTFGLLITFSRGAWAHFVVSLACFTLALLAFNRTSKITVTGLTMIGASAVLVVTYFSDDIARALSDSYFSRRLSFQSYDSKRFGLIFTALFDIANYPLGVGPYQARTLYGWEPHNSFVLLGLQNGLFALLGYLILFFAAMYRCLKKIIRKQDGWFKYAMILSLLVGLFVLSNVVSSLHWRHLYVVLGLAFGEYRSNLFFEPQTGRA